MITKLIEGKNGKYSSKRFVFIISSISAIAGFFYAIQRVSTSSPELIPEILSYFLIYNCFIGGFITLEMINSKRLGGNESCSALGGDFLALCVKTLCFPKFSLKASCSSENDI